MLHVPWHGVAHEWLHPLAYAGGQGGQLDPSTVELDLLVGAPHEVDRVAVPPHQIARVQPEAADLRARDQ